MQFSLFYVAQSEQEELRRSIYFGGGTPSLLNEGDLHKIFEKLSQHFTWDQKSEITLESNPDDLDVNKLALLQRLGINRLSIGVQSFFDEDLVWMNRAHNADEAHHCIKANKISIMRYPWIYHIFRPIA